LDPLDHNKATTRAWGCQASSKDFSHTTLSDPIEKEVFAEFFED
jgi:hypothetical protein